jgi:hypothetical protein
MFFAVTVVMSLLLYYPTPSEFRWVPVLTASLGGFWAVAWALEDLSSPASPPRRPAVQSSQPPGVERESPFGPPPPPGVEHRS